MLITPKSGRSAHEVTTVLEDLLRRLDKPRSTSLPNDRLVNYREWATEAMRRLRPLIGPDDLGVMVTTRAFWLIQGQNPYADGALGELVTAEIESRAEIFEEVRKALRAEMGRWDASLGRLVVPDSNVFLHGPEAIDWWTGTRSRPTDNIHVVLPMVVVDELDRLKRHPATKTRARSWLRQVTHIVDNPQSSGRLEQRPPIPAGGDVVVAGGLATLSVLADIPGSRRLPIADDEIIAQSLRLQDLAGHRVTVMTYDTAGMVFRVGHARLELFDNPPRIMDA